MGEAARTKRAVKLEAERRPAIFKCDGDGQRADLTPEEDDAAYAARCSAVTLQSSEKGFFRKVADDVVASAGSRWLRQFGRLKSNEERIAECWTDPKIKRLVGQMMGNLREVYRGKSAAVSKQRRLEAECLYESGKTDRSLVALAQSIVKAPSAEAEENADNDPNLALALWNRSAIFYEREKVLYCLDDIKLCLREKLPDNLRLEAYWRMADCYIFLKRFDEARITLNIVLRMAEEGGNNPVSVGWMEKVRWKQCELASVVSEGGTRTVVDEKKRQPTVTAENTAALEAARSHVRMKQISSKLALAETSEAGRFFVAAEAIQTGDIVVVEDAYVSCLSVDKFGSHCYHCMRRLETAIPCPSCSAIAFCSLACRTCALRSYHKFECRYLDVLIGSGMSILCFAALRIVSQQSVAYFESADLNRNNGDGDHPYRRVYHRMVTHEEKRSADDFLRRTLMAFFLLSILKKSGYFAVDSATEPTSENYIGRAEILIGAVLLRNLEVLQFNAHEISETVATADSVKVANVGVGLYASASYFNHECFPAVARFFRGSTLTVYAVRPIAEQRTVSDCYGPTYARLDGIERRRRLRARYRFECQCVACVQDWPLSDRSSSPSLLKIRCLQCGSVIDVEPSSGGKSCRCEKCDKSMRDEYEAASEDVDRLWALLKKPTQNLTLDDIQSIRESTDTLDRRIVPPHDVYLRVSDKLLSHWSLSQAAYQSPH